ncbi:MAG: hypothetical protein J0H14_11530 [Alphaproteobacteria bacterium]|nr:hypothetical protein [Alphaproteobacteria bacterium]
MTFERATIWLAALIALGACSPAPAPSAQTRANQATVAACRQRADEVFQRQNRAALFTQDNRDSPGSGSYVSGITTRGLSERFGWDRQVADCVRNQGAAEETAPAPVGPASTGPTMTPTRR